jgi:hypothetical protein
VALVEVTERLGSLVVHAGTCDLFTSFEAPVLTTSEGPKISRATLLSHSTATVINTYLLDMTQKLLALVHYYSWLRPHDGDYDVGSAREKLPAVIDGLQTSSAM